MALRAVLDHPKLFDLSHRLGLPKYAAVGVLESIWHLTGRYAPQGNIGKLSDVQIAAWIGWEGSPDDLIEALVESGWLDRTLGALRLCVHDWHEHADDATKLSLKRKGLRFTVPTVSLQCRDSVPTVSRQCSDKVANLATGSGLPEPVPVPEPEPDDPSVSGETTGTARADAHDDDDEDSRKLANVREDSGLVEKLPDDGFSDQAPDPDPPPDDEFEALVQRVEGELLKAHQFQVAGVHTGHLAKLVSQLLDAIDAPSILLEAQHAVVWLSKTSAPRNDAVAFFRNWMKRAVARLQHHGTPVRRQAPKLTMAEKAEAVAAEALSLYERDPLPPRSIPAPDERQRWEIPGNG